MQDGAVCLEYPSLLVGKNFDACLVLRVVQQVSVQMFREEFEIVFDVHIGIVSLVRHEVGFRLAVLQPLLALGF